MTYNFGVLNHICNITQKYITNKAYFLSKYMQKKYGRSITETLDDF